MPKKKGFLEHITEAARSIKSIFDQAHRAAERIEEILKERPEIDSSYGIYLLGMSQGGMIARKIIELNLLKTVAVKGIVTVGTPNLGIDDSPDTLKSKEGSFWDGAKAVGRYFVEDGFKGDSSKGPLHNFNRIEELDSDKCPKQQLL